MSKIVLHDLAKSFGTKKVLDGVSLSVAPGESLTIIGQSGTGKSVMLKCILGLMRPDRGSIKVDGEELVGMNGRELDRVRAKFGMLFQGGALFDSLPVWRNISFALSQGRMGSAKALRKVAEENLEKVGLDKAILDLKPSELSGGMQKRVALARAIAARPEIIFFDEPTTGLDPIRAAQINELIVSLTREAGMTALTITHDMGSVNHISDRVAMLHQGRIIWEGPRERLYESGNASVDQFVQGKSEGPLT